MSSSQLKNVRVADYYGVSVTSSNLVAARGTLAKELLRDLVAIGALVLPPGVDVSEFVFEHNQGYPASMYGGGDELTLVRRKSREAPGTVKVLKTTKDIGSGNTNLLTSAVTMGSGDMISWIAALTACVNTTIRETPKTPGYRSVRKPRSNP